MLVTLVGGTRDGESFEVKWWQDVLYVTKLITLEDHKALNIDESVAWKPPEEVYRRHTDDVFKYDRTVHYKPEDVC